MSKAKKKNLGKRDVEIKNKTKWEFSKKILFWTMFLFCVTLFCSLVFSWYGKDMTGFMYSIPATAGILGSAIIFYLNKAKIENVCKGKIEFFKFKMDYYKNNPNQLHELESELSIIDNQLTSKLDQELVESINEKIEKTF